MKGPEKANFATKYTFSAFLGGRRISTNRPFLAVSARGNSGSVAVLRVASTENNLEKTNDTNSFEKTSRQ